LHERQTKCAGSVVREVDRQIPAVSDLTGGDLGAGDLVALGVHPVGELLYRHPSELAQGANLGEEFRRQGLSGRALA
jgi:hypothetical protein